MSTKVGSIYIEVKGDDTAWKKQMTELRASATASGKNVAEALNSAISSKSASAGIRTLSTELKQLSQTAKVPEKQFKQTADAISESFKDVAQSIGMTEKEFSALNEKMLRAKAMNQAENSLRNISRAANLSHKEIQEMAVQMGYTSQQAREMADKIDRTSRATKQADGVFAGFGGTLKTVRAAALGYATVLATMELSNFTSGIIKQGAELDALTMTYKNMTGSTAQANAEMKFIQQTAEDLGLSLTTLETSYKNIYSAAKNTALEGQNTRDIFLAVNKAAAVLGMSADDTSGTLRALGQMISKGCHAKGTLIRMFDGSVKKVEHIKSGDKLIGPDGKSRNVLHLVYGQEEMFRVVPEKGRPFVVNLNHILRVKDNHTGTNINIKLKRVLQNPKRYQLIHNSWGLVFFDVEPVGVDEFFGFNIDGDQLYYDAQGFVHHNSVQAEELRGQLGERLPGAFQMAAEAMDVSTQELNKMLEQGEVAATDLLPKLAVVLENRFGDAAEDAGDRARAAFERFGNAVVNLQRAIAQSGILDSLATMANKASQALNAISDLLEGPSETELRNILLARKQELIELQNTLLGVGDESEKQARRQISWWEKIANGMKQANEQGFAFRQEINKLKDDTGQGGLAQISKEIQQINTDLAALSMGKFGTGVGEGQLGDVLDPIKHKAEDEFTEAMKRAKKAAESLKDLQVQAALEAEFEGLDNYDDHLREKEEMTKNTEQSLADIRVQQALDSYFEDFDNWDEIQKKKADAEEKARRERERAEEKARREYEREWERVYDDMHDFAADTFYDFFKGTKGGWEGLLDSMEDMFYRSLANMAAKAAMTNIFGPMMNSMAGTALGGFFGLPSMAAGTDGGGGFGVNPFGLKNLTGIGNLFGVGGWASGVSATGGIGAAYGAYQGPGMGAAIAGANGASTALANIGAAAGPALIAAAGAKIISEVASGWGDRTGRAFFYGGDASTDHTYITGSERGENVTTVTKDWNPTASALFDYQLAVAHSGADAEIKKSLIEYFDMYFAAIDEMMPGAVDEALSDFRADAYGARRAGSLSMEEVSQAVFDEMYAGLVQQIVPGSTSFDKSFFSAIAPEGGTSWDALVQFGSVVQENDTFVEDFNRRLSELGQTSVDAYTDIQSITAALSDMDVAVSAIVGTDFRDAINATILAWEQQIGVMREAQATAEQLAEAERKKNIVVGAQLTGVTQASVSQAIMSGSDIDGIIAKTLEQSMSSQIANQLMSEYLADFNAAAAEVFETSGWDAYVEFVNSYDFGPAKDAYKDFVDTIEEETKDLKQAVKDAQSAYNSAKDAYLDRLYEELSLLEDELADAKDNYISLLQEEYTQLETNYNNAKSVLEQVISNEERLIDARRNAAKSIDDFIADLQGSTRAPVQSLGFFEKRYEQLLEDAKTAAPEDIGTAVSDLTRFTGQYLDFAAAYGGAGYKDRYAKVMDDLQDLSAEQLSAADVQEARLSDVKSALDLSNEKLKSLDDTFQDYLAAQSALDQGSWMKDAIDTLQKTEGWTDDLLTAQERYNAAKLAMDDSWYQDEIDGLEGIKGSIDDLKDALDKAFGDMAKANIEYISEGLENTFNNLNDFFGPIVEMITGVNPGDWWDNLKDNIDIGGIGSGGSGTTGGSSGTSDGGSSGGGIDDTGEWGSNPNNPANQTPDLRDLAEDYALKLYASIGRGPEIVSSIGTDYSKIDQSGYNYWVNELMGTGSQSAFSDVRTEFRNFINDYVVNNDGGLADYVEAHKSFMYGGTVYGPQSGYTVPVTFHGTEHVVSDPNMDEIKRIVAQSQGSPVINLTARITIGNQEVKDFNIELVRTDPEMQYEVRRVANG